MRFHFDNGVFRTSLWVHSMPISNKLASESYYSSLFHLDCSAFIPKSPRSFRLLLNNDSVSNHFGCSVDLGFVLSVFRIVDGVGCICKRSWPSDRKLLDWVWLWARGGSIVGCRFSDVITNPSDGLVARLEGFSTETVQLLNQEPHFDTSVIYRIKDIFTESDIACLFDIGVGVGGDSLCML